MARAMSTATRRRAAQRIDAHGCAVEMSMVVPPSCEQVLQWSCFHDIVNPEEPENWDSGARHDDGGACQAQAAESPYFHNPNTTLLDGSWLSAALEEPQQVRVLLDRFFAHVHVKNPILDEAATRKMVLAKAAADGDLGGFDWTPDSCLALLICALGSLSTPFGPSTDTMPGTAAYSSAHVLFRAAQKRLGLLMASEGIVGPQCFFLAGVFAMCNFQPVKAWRYFVQAVAECQQFPFLASRPCCGGGGGGSGSGSSTYHHHHHHLQGTLQQAVYWSSWKSERELRGDVRHPDFLASVSDHDSRLYPPFFPTPPAPRADMIPPVAAPPDINQSRGEQGWEQSREHISWYFYLAEISLRRLSVRMSAEMVDMREAHASSRQAFLDSMAAALPSYEAQAGEWLASLPPCMLLEGTADQDGVCRFVLRGHLINLYETMYWPFLAAALDLDDHGHDHDHESRGRVSGRTRGAAAGAPGVVSKFIKQAQRGLDNHMDRLLVNRAGYYHRHHGTDLLLRSCARSALVLLAASRRNEAARHDSFSRRPSQHLSLPDGWENQIQGVVALLDFWAAETTAYDDCRRVLRAWSGRSPPG